MMKPPKPNYDLPDVAMRDPFETPPEVEIAVGDPMERAVSHVLPLELRKKKVCLFATRTTHPKSCIDARPVGECAGCRYPTWLSPSSLRMDLSQVVIVCTDCATRGLRATAV